MKNIHRRKSPQSQQIENSVGSSLEVRKPAVEGEIELLRKEKSLMMHEVIELQQQQRGTVQHMEAVNEKLQAAVQRQRQMVSFMAKVFQNPAYLARLQPKNQITITSPKTAKKFVKHQQHKLVMLDSSKEGQIMKYRADLGNLAEPSGSSDFNQVAVEQIPHRLSEDTVGNLGLGVERMPFQIENIASDELAAAHGFLKPLEQVREEVSGLESLDPHFHGKSVVSPQPEDFSEYFVSFPEDLAKEKNFREILSTGFEKTDRQEEEVWSMGFEAGAGMSSSNAELWSNISNFNVPDLGVSGGLSDIWDLGSTRVRGVPGFETWPADESPFDEFERQTGQQKNDSS